MTAPGSEMRDAALGYARRGIPVFPVHYIGADGICSCGGPEANPRCKPAKHPIPPGGHTIATTALDVVEAWWTKTSRANIGMPTGRKSGVLVLDGDGDRGVRTLEEAGYPEEAPKVKTGGGGLHVYVKYLGDVMIRNSAGKLGPGLDVRGEGGYVLLPPSRNADGPYEWIVGRNGSLPGPPSWLRRKLEEETRSGNNGGLFDMAGALAGVPEGQRDEQMFRLAGLLRSRGVERDIAEGVVLHAAANCDPPFPEDEARQKVENAYRYEAGTLRRSSRTDTTDTTDAGHWLRELPEAPSLPIEVLPAPCKRLVEEAAAAIVCPPEFVAVPLLVMLGAAIGTSRVVRLKGGWTESAALYAVIVALPGKKKTPALKVATEAAREKQGDYRREYREAKEEYEAEVRQWEADKKAATKEGKPAPEPPQKLVMKRTVVEDTTVEALAAILEENPRGVLVARDELSAFVRGMDQYKNHRGTDRQFYLSAWSNSPVTVDRKNLDEPLFLLKPFVGVIGSIQPGVLSELTANRRGLEGDGFLDRFLFAYPEPMPSRWSDEEISAGAVFGVYKLYDDLISKLEPDYNEGGDPVPKAVPLSDEARARFRKEADALQEETEQPGFPNVLRGPWSKLEAYLARLALVLAMVRTVSTPTGEERVELEDVEGAAALLHYFKAHARRAYLQLYGERREDWLVADLTKLLKENLGKWEEDPTKGWEDPAKKLFEVLKERGCDALPTRPDELAKEILALSSHVPSLKARRGKRGDERVLRIWLVEPPLPVVSGVRGVRDVRVEGLDGSDDAPISHSAHNGRNPGPTDADEQQDGAAEKQDVTEAEEAESGTVTGVTTVTDSTGDHSAAEHPPTTVVKPDDVPALVEEVRSAEAIGLDLETTGLDPRQNRARIMSLATEKGAWAVDLFETDPVQILEALKVKTLVIHNAAFDLGFLHQLGYEHEGEVIDTMLLSQLLYAGANVPPLRKGRTSHALDAVVDRELGEVLDKEYQRADWAGELSPEMVEYAARDARVLIPLHDKLIEKIEEAGLADTLKIEQRAQPAIEWMSRSGLPFDKNRWLEIAREAREEAARLSERLQEMAPPHPEGEAWNWNSVPQVKRVLSMLGLEVENTRDKTLARIDHPFVSLLREYRKKSGIATRQGEKWLRTEDGADRVIEGRMYPSWKQIGAATGRMACASPNLQGIPHGYGHHSCVRAPEGRVLIKADYSQIELRLAAKMWGEPVMLQTFREGGDVHATTTRSITGKEEITKEERKLAKAVNFGLIFGQGAEALRNYARNDYGVEMTLAEADTYRRRFFGTYEGIARWHSRTSARVDRGEYETRTLTGRRRRDVRSYTEHLNAPVQGTAADGMKLAFALLWERREECPGAVPVLAVHDEIVVECDEEDAEKAKAWLVKAMKDGMDAVVNTSEPRVPIEVEASVAQTWGD